MTGQPPAPPARPAWAILLVGAIALAGGLLLALACKSVVEGRLPALQTTTAPASPSGPVSGKLLLLKEKQPLGWVPYFLAAAAVGLAVVCSLVLSARLIGRWLPRFLLRRPARPDEKASAAARWRFRLSNAAVGLWNKLVMPLLALVWALIPVAVICVPAYFAFQVLKQLGGAHW